MNLEKFIKPIESGSIEEHESLLEDKIIGIQLEYIDRLFSGKIEPVGEEIQINDISGLLLKFTHIPSKLLNSCEDRMGDKYDGDCCKSFQNNILNSINDLYKNNHDHWIEKTQQLIKSGLDSLGPVKENKKKEEKWQAGLINFSKHDLSDKLDGTESIRQFKDLDIKGGDMYLSIHLDDFYKQKGDDTKNLFSSSSLEKLAVKIIDEFPEAKAVVGESWLMSTPIAKRIGFETSTELSDKSLSGQFWGQFIDSNGQINKERVSKFLETGIPPYEVAIGVMKTEDFLKKYLPPERRGKIILKELNQSFEKKFKKEEETLLNICSDFNKFSYEDIESIISSFEYLGGFSKTENGKDFIKDIKDLKRNNQTVEDIKKNRPLERFQDPFREYIKNIKYSDKQVVI